MASDPPGWVAARGAGLRYVVIIVLGVAQAELVSSRLPPLDDPAAVVEALDSQALPFRLGVASDVALYALVLVVAGSLYVVVRRMDRHFKRSRRRRASMGGWARVRQETGRGDLQGVPERADGAAEGRKARMRR